jgi:hypothetical protein
VLSHVHSQDEQEDMEDTQERRRERLASGGFAIGFESKHDFRPIHLGEDDRADLSNVRIDEAVPPTTPARDTDHGADDQETDFRFHRSRTLLRDPADGALYSSNYRLEANCTIARWKSGCSVLVGSIPLHQSAAAVESDSDGELDKAPEKEEKDREHAWRFDIEIVEGVAGPRSRGLALGFTSREPGGSHANDPSRSPSPFEGAARCTPYCALPQRRVQAHGTD